jgi:hypothetical protein
MIDDKELMMTRPECTHPPLSPEKEKPRLYTFVCFLFAGLLLALIFVPEYLPMVDLPQHAAQVAMWKQFDAGTLPTMENHSLNLFTPYLGGYSVARIFSSIMPVTAAIKATVFLALLLPLLALYLELRKRPFLRWSVFLVIPFLFNWSFYWGFLNFIFAIGPMLICLFSSIRLIDRRSGYCNYVIGTCALLLFFFHIFCALIYVGLTGVYVMVKTKNLKQIGLSLIAFLPFFALTTGWQISRSSPGQGSALSGGLSGTFWFLGINRITNLPTTMLSGAYYGEQIATSVLLATALVLIGALYYGGIRKERLLLLLLTALAYLLLPQYSLKCAYIYQRFAFLVIPLAVYAVGDKLAEKKAFCRILQVCSVIIPVLYLSSLMGVFTAFSAETLPFTNFKRHMEKNKRVLSLMVDNRAASVRGPVMLHFPSWYQATHGGYVAFNFNHPVKYHPDGATPRVGNKFLWNPGAAELQKFEAYDYYILKAPLRAPGFPFNVSGEKFELLLREGDWHLYSRRKHSTAVAEQPL